MIGYFWTGSGLQSAALHYFNAAAVDPRGAIGAVYDPEPHLMLLVLLDSQARQHIESVVFVADEKRAAERPCLGPMRTDIDTIVADGWTWSQALKRVKSVV